MPFGAALMTLVVNLVMTPVIGLLGLLVPNEGLLGPRISFLSIDLKFGALGPFAIGVLHLSSVGDSFDFNWFPNTCSQSYDDDDNDTTSCEYPIIMFPKQEPLRDNSSSSRGGWLFIVTLVLVNGRSQRPRSRS